MPITDPISTGDGQFDQAQAMQENLERMRVAAAEDAKVKQVVEDRRLAREKADQEEARRQEDNFVARIEDITTREAMLDHIRRMRAPPPAPPAPPPLTEAMQKRLEQEQAAGRAALAAHQAFAASHGLEMPGTEKRKAEMIHPNPAQQEPFLDTRATRGKRRT
jgi:hypothetical protein